jgi:hypothetical protein
MAKPQQVVITIGHLSLLLPDDTGVTTVLKTLSRGASCYYFQHTRKVELSGCDCQVSLAYLPPGTPVVDKENQPVTPAPRTKKGRLALPAPTLLTLMEGGAAHHG